MNQKQVIDELTSSHETHKILIQNILNSHDKSLSLLAATRNNTNESNEESHLYAGMGITRLESPCSFSESPHGKDSHRDFKDPDHKDLRTRRKSNGSMEKLNHQVKVTREKGVEGGLDVGYTWRKYGQKDILGAKHPRGYYKCIYRQVQGCFATKQMQKIDKDPNIFDITYRGTHTFNPGSFTTSPPSSMPLQLPPSSSSSREVQQPSQQNQLSQSPKILLNYQKNVNVTYENLDTPTFHFPSTSNNNFIFPTLDVPFHGIIPPSFISLTTSGSTYFTMSQPRMDSAEGNSSVMVAESELNAIVSTAMTSTSSPTVDVDFTFSEVKLGNNHNFDDLLFFD